MKGTSQDLLKIWQMKLVKRAQELKLWNKKLQSSSSSAIGGESGTEIPPGKKANVKADRGPASGDLTEVQLLVEMS